MGKGSLVVSPNCAVPFIVLVPNWAQIVLLQSQLSSTSFQQQEAIFSHQLTHCTLPAHRQMAEKVSDQLVEHLATKDISFRS